MKQKYNINWTAVEKEIWKQVEKYTKLIINGKTEKFLEYFHKDYLGWNYFENHPINKVDIKKELSNLPSTKIISYKLEPVSIQVKNNIAIVHYNYSAEYINSEGTEKSKLCRYTDILLKDENRWVLIGDHIDKNTITANKNISNKRSYKGENYEE